MYLFKIRGNLYMHKQRISRITFLYLQANYCRQDDGHPKMFLVKFPEPVTICVILHG